MEHLEHHGTSLNLIIIFHGHFPSFHPFRGVDFRWSPGGGSWSGLSSWISWSADLVVGLGRLQGYQRGAESWSSIWAWTSGKSGENRGKMVGKSWENGGKMVGTMLRKYVNIDVWNMHIFPQEFCGISSGHLWTRCITKGAPSGKWWDGPVNKSDPQLWWISSYSFTIVLLCFMLCFTHFPHWNRSIFELMLTGYPEEKQLHVAGQKQGNNGLIILIWGWPDVWPFKWRRCVF